MTDKGKMTREGPHRQRISHKRFAVCLVSFFAIFVAMNYLIWKGATELLLTKKYDGGDLARMGYLPGFKENRKKSDDLPVRHLEMKEFRGQRVDVLTIGDSFSQGGGEGRNSFYQDYLATTNNFTVLNVYPYETGDLVAGFSPVSTLSVLYNSGYLDLIRPRYVLLESVERHCVLRFALPFTFAQTDSIASVSKYYAEKSIDLNYLPKVGFINEGNFKFIYYNFMYLFSDNAFRRLVYRENLDRPLFSGGESSSIIFHGEDLLGLCFVSRENVRALNNNLNRLSDILAAKGIRLVFMPVVDKYDLYSGFILRNPYPKNTFFEELRPLPRRYMLIDTKAILLRELQKGEKDIFYSDDTHWTWRASKTVFENVKFPGVRFLGGNGHTKPLMVTQRFDNRENIGQ